MAAAEFSNFAGIFVQCFPCGSAGKESSRNVEDLGLIPELERSPGGGNGIPLQYSCLKSPTDRGTWWATVQRAAELDRTR